MRSEELGEEKSRRAGRERLEASRSRAGGAQNSVVNSCIGVVCHTCKKCFFSGYRLICFSGFRRCEKLLLVPFISQKTQIPLLRKVPALVLQFSGEQWEVGPGTVFKSLYCQQKKPVRREESLSERSKDSSLCVINSYSQGLVCCHWSSSSTLDVPRTAQESQRDFLVY